MTACSCLCTGRAQTVILVKFMGIGLLLLMGLAPQLWTNLAVIIPVYIVRTAVINSAYPLQKSILMDYVPKVRLLDNACTNDHDTDL